MGSSFSRYVSAVENASEWRCLRRAGNSSWSIPLCTSSMKSRPSPHPSELWTNNASLQTWDDIQSVDTQKKGNNPLIYAQLRSLLQWKVELSLIFVRLHISNQSFITENVLCNFVITLIKWGHKIYSEEKQEGRWASAAWLINQMQSETLGKLHS